MESIYLYGKDALKSFIGGKVNNLSEEEMEIFYGPEIPDKLPPLIEPGLSIPAPSTDTIFIPKSVRSQPTGALPDLCKKIKEKENKTDLIKYLEECANYNELMFGTHDEMQVISKCYVVIIEKASQKINAILDKGDSARLNFMTNEMDYFGKYNNTLYEMIFVQEL